ncbi:MULTISPECIES: GNAT family N-acetyltransferase [unclassified Pseudomonas]|uniref:GNAT family N-acetyltransferase n=1 Tax=unclassified Pseudomonas TaxID=196821 RepID=UPI000A1F994F|nr:MULTISPECIES: GNAT family N-acetyltransferase [unclassified Pseudomonas]
MSGDGFKIRKANSGDAEILGLVGPAAYAAAYSYLWMDCVSLVNQLQTFSCAAFNQLLRREDCQILVAVKEGIVVGFIVTICHSRDPITLEPGGAEISRIYILPGCQGQQIGLRLLEASTEILMAQGFKYVWLDVMASAELAKKAYMQWGFIEIGTRIYSRLVKTEFSEMIVFKRELN